MRLAWIVALLVWAGGAWAHKGATICIDPGHPSEVGPGTRGKKITEMRAVWLVGQKLERRLKARGMKVVMTKSREKEKVTNRRRAEIANQAQADLMIRLHCDAQSGRGFATYYPDRAGRAQGRTGPSPEVLRQSKLAATAFHSEAARVLRGHLPVLGLYTDRRTKIGAQQGALTGSIFSEVPVLLVELVVLTHPQDEAFILTDAGQEKLAEALEMGILKALAAVRAAPPAKRPKSPAARE